MTVRVRYKITASISSTSSEEKDLGNVAREVIYDGSGEGGTRKTTLAAGATDVSLALADVAAATFLLIIVEPVDENESIDAIEVKKNDVGGEVIEIVPLSGSKQGHLLLSTQSITALYASNPGTVDASITVMSAGD
jgi:hypothetical protein